MFAVIGTTTADLFVSGVENMPRFDGDEFTTTSLAFCRRPLTMTIGGNGANSAYVLRSLGAPVRLLSATGTNDIGQMVTNWLAEKGVDLNGFTRWEQGAATNTTVVDDQLNRLSFYYPGVFSALSDADLPANWWEGVHTLLITGVPLLPGFRDGGFSRTLQVARTHGIATALDIGPAIGQPATLEELAPLLPLVDYVLTNEYELAVATETNDVALGGRLFRAAGSTCTIIKQGAAGAIILSGDDAQQVAGFPVEATVTVGAGDSFNASFLFARREGLSLVEAARFANATASLVVQSGRSALGSPSRAQVDAFLQAQRMA